MRLAAKRSPAVTAPLLLVISAGLLSAPTTRAEVGSASATFRKLTDDAWRFDLGDDPLFATHVGDHQYDDKLPDRSLAATHKRLAAKRAFHERWKSIARERLKPAEQIDYDIFGLLLADELAEGKFKTYLMPITNRWGFHIAFAELADDSRLESVADYENYIARLAAFRRYTHEHIELMREGIRNGYTLPAAVLDDYRRPIDAQIVDDPRASALYKPLAKFPERIPGADRQRLAAQARVAIVERVVPGYRDFLAFMRDEYVPAARSSIGASALPDGREFYRHRVRKFTTLDLAPEAVHELGLSEVKRIDAEMLAAMKKSGFRGTFAEFVEHLRSDPAFYATSAPQLMKEAAYVMKRVDAQLLKLFKRLPRTPCGLREVPAYIAPGTTTAYYSLPSGDGVQPGYYWVNTYNLKSRPLYEIEALTLHEALPGHHLQLALQQELGTLAPFRRYSDFTVFVEGWGLYAERLGLEIGMYEDPYSNFGRLSYEMWRACRLVVDTGIHYLGWTRQQAIDFMAAHSALALHNIRAEVDRYIAWPGQALAYKVGELKIRELRSRAEKRLGSRFDVREFHAVVLGQGAVPLATLEDQVNQYIDRVAKSFAVEAPQ